MLAVTSYLLKICFLVYIVFCFNISLRSKCCSHKITSEKRQTQEGRRHGGWRERERQCEKKDEKMRGAFEM